MSTTKWNSCRPWPKHVTKCNLIVIFASYLMYVVYWRCIIYYTKKPKFGSCKYSSHPLNLLLYDPFKYYLPIHNYVFQIVCFLHVFPAERSMYLSSHACNMACLSYPLLFAHRNNMWREIQIMTLFLTQSSTVLYLQPFNTSTYSLQNMVFHLLQFNGQGSACKTS